MCVAFLDDLVQYILLIYTIVTGTVIDCMTHQLKLSDHLILDISCLGGLFEQPDRTTGNSSIWVVPCMYIDYHTFFLLV